MYVLCKGQAVLFWNGVFLRHIEPGHYFGELSLFPRPSDWDPVEEEEVNKRFFSVLTLFFREAGKH